MIFIFEGGIFRNFWVFNWWNFWGIKINQFPWKQPLPWQVKVPSNWLTHLEKTENIQLPQKNGTFPYVFCKYLAYPLFALWDRTGAADKGVQPPLHRSCLRSVRDWCSLSLGLWSFGSLRSLLGSLRSANNRFVWMVLSLRFKNSSTKYIPYFVFWQQPKFLGCF